jgi:hypothetical protein
VNSFIPHRCHFTNRIIDGRLYIFSDLAIDLNLINIYSSIDTYSVDTLRRGVSRYLFRVLFTGKEGGWDQGFARHKTMIIIRVNTSAEAAIVRE